ncbi:HECT-type E3 ubiquitin transferase [Malassezia sp. CBS 17886]|nr:HECT-type E3 ubiquitin transferase [Malassezia sp. CBS 17886]
MDPLFSGSSRRARQVNLGGARGASAAELSASAREARAQRHMHKQRAAAATTIQALFRRHAAAARTRAACAHAFDALAPQVALASVPVLLRATQALVFSFPPRGPAEAHACVQRLSVWAQAVLADVWAPAAVSPASWETLVCLAARQMLALWITHASLVPVADSALWLRVLAASAAPGFPPPQRTHVVGYLVPRGWHAALHALLVSLPLTPDTASARALCVELMVLPLRLFPAEDAGPTGPLRAVTLRTFGSCVLSVPQLLHRISTSSVATLAAEIPSGEIAAHIQTLGAHADRALRGASLGAPLDETPVNSPFFTANVAALTWKRVPLMKTGAEVTAYLRMMAVLQTALPPGVLPRTSADSDEEDGDASDGAPPARPRPVDERTLRHLRILPSDAHIRAVLAASSRFSASTRPALCAFLLATMHAWPERTRESVCTTVLYGDDTARGAARGAAPAVGTLVRELWRGWLRGSALARRLHEGRTQLAAVRRALADPALADEWTMFIVLSTLYSRCLLTMGDDEFLPSALGAPSPRNPLTLDEVVSFSGLLRNTAFAMYWGGGGEGDGRAAPARAGEGGAEAGGKSAGGRSGSGAVGGGAGALIPDTPVSPASLRDLCTRLLQQLHTRDARHPFTPRGHWHMVGEEDLASFIQSVVLEERDARAAAHEEGAGPPWRAVHSVRTHAFVGPRLGVLNAIPFVVPFEVRVEVFRQFVRNDVERLGIARDVYMRGPRHRVTIRRSAVAEDGMAQLNGLGAHLKEPVEIVFIDQWGQPEPGIDGGGVFKEFLTALVREVFDTDRGLWRTNSEQELYPSPHSYARAPEQLQWYTFLGRILGKALYDGILVDVKLAGFFLGKWLGHQGYLDDVASLDSLDHDLYRGLLALKHYDGDVENDFALNFTVSDEEFGVSHTTELVPGGAGIPVTRENRLSYIYQVTRYRLSRQIEPQCAAFFQGLCELIDPRWLRVLNRDELGVLVRGTDDPVDLDDLRANTVYGGFHEKDLCVQYFWDALAAMDQASRRAFLKFVTSSPNPPLLGFAELNPKFAIRNAGADESRLPTASTCVNLLKLPAYSSREQCLEKLQYAIHSGAGFDLS